MANENQPVSGESKSEYGRTDYEWSGEEFEGAGGMAYAAARGCAGEILIALSFPVVSYLINTGQSGILATLLQQTISSGALNILTSKN